MFYSSVILNGTETHHNFYTFSILFYSSVILNGTETRLFVRKRFIRFYSSVILNGTETLDWRSEDPPTFYSSVILNGTETRPRQENGHARFYSSVILNGMDRLARRREFSESDKRLSSSVIEAGISPRGLARIKNDGDKSFFGGKTNKQMKEKLNTGNKPWANKAHNVVLAGKTLHWRTK